MYCSNCGNKINQGENFCFKCGTKIMLDQNINNKTNNNSTRLCLIILIIVLTFPILTMSFVYNYRLNQKTSTVKVPYANQTILPNTQITENMISYVDLPIHFIVGSYHKNSYEVIEKCSENNTIIAKGSIFYIKLLTNCNRK